MSDPDLELISRLELIYVADPMCSWCWGFAPVIERIDARFAIPVTVLVGGLRPGEAAQPLDDGMRASLGHHWEQVERASGQPFDHAALDREGWVYDTLVPDTAVVLVRELAPERALAFLSRLQRAFYAERVDVTDPAVYPGLVEPFGLDPRDFGERLASRESAKTAWRDFSAAFRLGVTGYPTLLLRDGATAYPVTRGWQAYEPIAGALERFLRTEHPDHCDALLSPDDEPSG